MPQKLTLPLLVQVEEHGIVLLLLLLRHFVSQHFEDLDFIALGSALIFNFLQVDPVAQDFESLLQEALFDLTFAL